MIEGKLLIKTNMTFYSHNGEQYRYVYGTVKVYKDSNIVKTNKKSVNWYIVVGDEHHNIIIAGCQIKYIMKLDINSYNATDKILILN